MSLPYTAEQIDTVQLKQIIADLPSSDSRASVVGRDLPLKLIFWALIRSRVWVGVLLSCLTGLLQAVAKPLMLRAMINAASGVDGGSFGAHMLLLDGLCLVLLLENWSLMQYKSIAIECSVKFSQASWALGHRKVARPDDASKIRGAGKAEKPATPSISALFGNDVHKQAMNFYSFAALPADVAALTGGAVLLFIFIGPIATTAGVVFLFITVFTCG